MSLKRIAVGVGIAAIVKAYQSYTNIKRENENTNTQSNNDNGGEDEYVNISTETVNVDGDTESASAKITFGDAEDSNDTDDAEDSNDTDDAEDSNDTDDAEDSNDTDDAEDSNDTVVPIEEIYTLINENFDVNVRSNELNSENVDDLNQKDGYAPLFQLTGGTRAIIEYMDSDDATKGTIQEFIDYRPNGYRRVIITPEQDIDVVTDLVNENIDSKVCICTIDTLLDQI